jgi:hypothetical protein
LKASEHVINDLNITPDKYVNVFETTIRVLGGLMAAYHLSGDARLLTRAETLGMSLLGAFDTPSHIPFADINLHTKRGALS